MKAALRQWFLSCCAVGLMLAVFGVVGASAETAEKVLFNFNEYPHGISPLGGLVADAQGTLYGTAWLGGAMGVGGVFKLAPNAQGGWTQTMIYSFSLAEGGAPQGEMVFDGAGNLYGINGNGAGTIFELTPQANGQWTESTVNALGGLIVDGAGILYGTTANGGASSGGTVYEIQP
jgi:uncharacterized repeat protein (TIGR03803 family)